MTPIATGNSQRGLISLFEISTYSPGHGRACPGHPGLRWGLIAKDVDARDKRGQDGMWVLRSSHEQDNESPVAAPARRPRRSRGRQRLSDAAGHRRPRRHSRARGLVQLSRRVHGARHAGHQGAAAGHHRPRYGGRDRRGRCRRQRLEGRRPRAGQSGQQEERPDGRNARRRHGGILPRRRRPARRHAGRR